MSSPLQILQQYWKHAAFRPLQEEIIQSVLQGKDCIALLPTGGGKSLCYWLPSQILKGITVVVSPLIGIIKFHNQDLKRKKLIY